MTPDRTKAVKSRRGSLCTELQAMLYTPEDQRPAKASAPRAWTRGSTRGGERSCSVTGWLRTWSGRRERSRPAGGRRRE